MADEEILEGQVEGSDEQEAEAAEETEKSLQDKLKEAVEVKVEEVGTLRKKLTVTLPREAIDEQLNGQYDELRREAQVPGFRKGRAPRRLLEKRFGSDVSETLVQQMVSSGYMAAAEKEDLKVLGDPLIWAKEKGAETETLMDVQKATELMKLPEDGPLVFSCEVEIRPEFDLPEIENIPLTKPDLSVSDEDVAQHVDRFRAMAGTYDTVVDGKVEADDLVVADVKMSCGDTVIKEEAGAQLAARPQSVEGVVLEKLGETLTGAKVGDACEISGDIPDSYAKAEFRGKKADFVFTVKQIQRVKLPELDDDFCKRLGFGSKTELTDWVRSDMESRLGEQVQQNMAGQVYEYLLEKTSFELPERMSERQINSVVARRMIDLYRQGIPPAEVGKRTDELKTSAREDAIRDLKLAFIMEKLSEAVEVDVSEAEINAQIAAIAQRQGRRFDRVRDELAKQDALADLYVRIRDDKLISQLIEKANVTEGEAKPKKSAKSAEKKKAADTKADDAKADDSSAEEGEAKKPRPKRTPPKKKD